jgi:hypothetical protein
VLKIIKMLLFCLLQTMLVVALFAAALAAKDRPLDPVDPGHDLPDCPRGCLCTCALPPPTTKSPFEEVAKSAKMAAANPAKNVLPSYYSCLARGCFCECRGALPTPTIPFPTRKPSTKILPTEMAKI